MKKIFRKALALVAGLFILSSSFSVFAFDLNYSGGSTSNSTGAGNTTSGYQISVISPTYGNNVGYRFSIVDGSGNLKSGSNVANIYLDNTTHGSAAYSSAQRFIISSGKFANKKQLANNTKIVSAYSAQACEYLAGNVGFFSIPGQDPANIRNWIQDSSVNYKNLKLIYLVCGLDLANASANDYVLIEPILRVKLAGVITAATPTELAVYGASVSGGGGYNGANGKLSNTGSGTLWNLQYYINREFPNMLYVDKDITVYSAVSVISSGRYTYNDIIQKGYGCSVLQVSNILPMTYTNTITHWKYVGTGGDNRDGTMKVMGNSTFKGKAGNSVTIPSNLVQSYTGYYNTGVAGSYWGTGTWSNKNIGSSFTQPSSAINIEYYYYPATYTNTITHWKYVGTGGDNPDGTMKCMGTSTFNGKYGESVTIPKSLVQNYAGYGNLDFAGSYWGTSTWSKKNIGSSFTQPSSAINIEYYYYKNILFDVNYDGIKKNLFIPNMEGSYCSPSEGGVSMNTNSASGVISLNGTQTDSFSLGKHTGIELRSGQKYNITLSYVGGSYSSQTGTGNNAGCFAFDFLPVGEFWTSPRQNADLTLPTAENPVSGASLTVTNTTAEQADGFFAWIWKNNGYVFDNYQFTVKIEGSDSATAYGPNAKTVFYTYVDLPVPVREGYTFKNWNTRADGNGDVITSSSVVTTDVTTLYAVWEPVAGIVYKVQHWLQNIDGDASLKDSNNYTLDYTESLAGAAGESITPEVKAYKGFTSPDTQTVTINPDGSTIVNYYYTRNRYTVTLNKGTGISATTGAGTYLYGASVTINATVSQGYTWNNWTGTYNTATQNYTFTMPAQNVTDTANAVLNTYTVVYDGNGSTGGSTPSSTHIYGVEKNLNANGFERSGHSFTGWNTEADGTGTAYADKQTVKNLTSVNGGVVTLYAQWKRNVKIVYKVQHWLQNIDGNASLKNSDNYTLADTESFSKEIYGDVNSDGYVNSADLTYLKKILLSMISEPITTGDVNGDGSTDILDLVRLKKYLAGAADESVTPEVKAYKGFTSPAAQTVTINPDGSTVVNYYYTRNRYTVTLNKGTGISATTGAGTYLYGASVTINATVSQGYTWSKWTGTYNTATQKYTFTMPAQNVTDTANAVLNTYTVVYDGNGSTGGSTPSSTHIYGVEKNLNANGYKKSGCTFTGWNTEADGTGTAYADKQTVKNLTSVNGGVVTLYAQWQARLTLVPLEPNAPYREDTEVVTSYWIVNSSTENCIPSDNIKVAFTVYNSNGDILKTADKTVIVPARDKNLIYFKWKVPEDLSRNDVTVKAVIKDGGSNYGLISKSYATVPYIYYTTPDTEYEAKAPDGFSVPTAPTDTGILSAKWWEYKYENGSFKKVNYGIGTKLYLSPLSAPDSLSAQITGGRLTLRSGYGFRSPFGAYTLGIEGYTMPDTASYTERQYAYALFPEFNYSFGENKCKTFKEVGNIFDFYDSYYTHINHYIPLYYPDGEYTFEIDVTDSWTPAGMITTSDLQSITVSGSLYDDHYIGRK